ncbi:MAG: glycosyltransferase [Acidobacteriota bacterium]|nr:glycosyltransferase [Acidobacteriota bacterium]
MSILRVVHVVPDLVPYGLENMLSHLVCSLDRTRFEPAVISLYGPREEGLENTLRNAGVRVFHLDKRRGLDPRMFGRLYKLFRALQPEIVHSHNYVLRYTLPAAMLARVPVMAHTIHNMAQEEVDRLGRWLQWLAFRGPVHPVAIGQELATSFRQVYGSAELTIIPNGIPVEAFTRETSTRACWRKREGFTETDVLYVCVARFFRQKNHATLIHAFANGPARNPHCKLLLAGDGDLRKDIELQGRRLGIDSQIRFLGRRSDVAEILSAADVFVLASLWEGNPLSVMEAMASGLPVIATTVGAVPELVENGVHGWLVPPGDSPALTEAMLRMIDPEKRRRMGGAAALRAKEKFDYRLMVQAYEALYERLILRTNNPGLPKAELAV